MEAWKRELYSYYNDSSLALSHHGIKGQKWGQRNGPPYPLSRSKSAAVKKSASTQKFGANDRTKKKIARNQTMASMNRRAEANTNNRLLKKAYQINANYYQNRGDKLKAKDEKKSVGKAGSQNQKASISERLEARNRRLMEKHSSKVESSKTVTMKRFHQSWSDYHLNTADYRKGMRDADSLKEVLNYKYGPEAWKRLERSKYNMAKLNSEVSRFKLLRNINRSQASYSKARMNAMNKALQSKGDVISKGKTYFRELMKQQVVTNYANTKTTVNEDLLNIVFNPVYKYQDYINYIINRKSYPGRKK